MTHRPSSWPKYRRTKIIPKYTNQATELVEADHQALYFTARQDQHNLQQVNEWIRYAQHGEGKFWSCRKRTSDSPALIAAVNHEQAVVVNNQIKIASIKFNLHIPLVLNNVVIQYYTQKAIYPVPRRIKEMPPWKGKKPPFGPFSWKIDEGESLKDVMHPLNVEDRARAKRKSDELGGWVKEYEVVRNGHFERKIHRHRWYC